MDKRKLIGTIIGVAMFAALIAGATFAWLTFTASITAGTYTAGGRNFVIDYSNGNGNISDVQILSNITTAALVNSTVTNKVTLTAKLNNANSPKGELKLTLHTTTDEAGLISADALKYSVYMCTDTTSGTSCIPTTPTPLAPQTVTSTTQILNIKTTTPTTTTTIASNTLYTRFIVYVWIDAEKFDESMLGKDYAGYIQATAEQLES